MTPPIPRPRKPDPLPGKWLGMRSTRDCQFESLDRTGEDGLREILAWAEDALADIFLAQKIGGNYRDPIHVENINVLYETIRNSMTRQDLIMGFLLNVQKSATDKANEQLKEFKRELSQLTDPDVF